MSERERIVLLLKTALERGYTDEQLRQYVQGIVAFNDRVKGG